MEDVVLNLTMEINSVQTRLILQTTIGHRCSPLSLQDEESEIQWYIDCLLSLSYLLLKFESDPKTLCFQSLCYNHYRNTLSKHYVLIHTFHCSLLFSTMAQRSFMTKTPLTLPCFHCCPYSLSSAFSF